MMTFISWTLLMVGLVIASLAVARTPDEATPLQLLTDTHFLVGIGAIVLSVVSNLKTRARGASNGGASDSDPAFITGKLDDILRALNEISDARREITRDQLVQRLDALINNDIFDIVTTREALIARWGYGPYAAFMSDFATAERFVSRAWSASVDHCEDEAFDYLKKAGPFFLSAQKSLEKIGV